MDAPSPVQETVPGHANSKTVGDLFFQPTCDIEQSQDDVDIHSDLNYDKDAKIKGLQCEIAVLQNDKSNLEDENTRLKTETENLAANLRDYEVNKTKNEAYIKTLEEGNAQKD